MRPEESNQDASGDREPNPPGEVSTIRGIVQVPALRISIGVVMATAILSLFIPDPAGRWAAITATALIAATPLVRVVWLIYRWAQERDTRFVATGIAMLVVVSAGAILAILQSG